uniref:Uncharacterized protein n=1 Tax=viral metagenome TaxID=1070528 RepID=A0A6C0EH85_9ZZZZ
MSKKANSNNIKINKKNLTLLIIVFIIVFSLLIFLYIYNRESFKNNTTNNDINNFANLKFDNKKVNNKYTDLIKHIGSPTYVEISANNVLNSATWMSPLNNYDAGLFNGDSISSKDGLDYIKINGFVGRKHHPISADMYVIAGKYIEVPDILMGPLKHASETINIEQLEVPPLLNKEFGKTQKHTQKGKSRVTGSCASVTISAITIKFVEDMIEKYHNGELDNQNDSFRNDYFKKEYDKALLKYLCEKEDPEISWINPEDFGEPKRMDSLDQCKDIEGFLNYSTLTNENKNKTSNLLFGTNCFKSSIKSEPRMNTKSGNYNVSANIDSSHNNNNNKNNKKAS